MKALIATLLVSLSLVGCSSDSGSGSDGDATTTDGGGTTTADSGNTSAGTSDGQTGSSDGGTTGDTGESEVTYRVTFNATWSAETHPVSFPNNPHFSGLVGAVHSEQVIFWESGQPATAGIELMAETGSKSEFIPEIEAAISEGRALSLLSGGGIGTSPGTVVQEFTVTNDYSELTLVSMLAPSPDWFVGVHNLNLRDASGAFVDRLDIELRLYDAGTDSGLLYDSGNIDTSPQDPIALVDDASTSLPFVAGTPVVGTFVIERVN